METKLGRNVPWMALLKKILIGSTRSSNFSKRVLYVELLFFNQFIEFL